MKKLKGVVMACVMVGALMVPSYASATEVDCCCPGNPPPPQSLYGDLMQAAFVVGGVIVCVASGICISE